MKLNNQNTQLTTIGTGSVLVLIGLLAGAALNYFYNFILASHFGAVQAGDFVFALTVITVTSMISQLGAQELLLKYVGAYRGSNEIENTGSIVRFGFSTGILGSVAGCVFLWFAADTIAVLAEKPVTAHLIKNLAPLCLALTVVNLSASALQGAKLVSTSVILREIGRPLAIVVSLLIAVMFTSNIQMTTNTLLFAHFILAVFTLSCFAYFFRREITTKFEQRTYRFREWFRFSLSVLLLDLFRSAFGWIDILILGFLVSSEELAVYFVAVRTALLIAIILRAFNAILAPLVAAYWYENNISQLRKAFNTATKWTWVLAIPISVVILLLSEEIMSLFGETYAQSYPVLQIIVLGQLVNCLTGGVGRILMMTGLQRLELYNSVAVFIAILFGTIISTKYFGLYGAAITASVVISTANIVKLIQVYKYHNIHPFDLTYLKIITCGLCTLFVGYITTTANLAASHRMLLISISVPLLFYTMCNFANILSSEEKALVLQKLQNRFRKKT